MYIDASNFPSSIARLTMEEKLCAGTTIHFSGWVSSLDKTTNDDKYNSAGYLLFSIVGIEADGNETVIESFCPGPIRADAQPYVGEMVGAEGYHADMPNWDGSYSIWQQFAFSFGGIRLEPFKEGVESGDFIIGKFTAAGGAFRIQKHIHLFQTAAFAGAAGSRPDRR